MLYGLYLSSAGMMVQRHRLDVIANNMANVNTTSFKRDVAVFRTRPVESASSAGGLRYREPVLDRVGGGTFVSPTYTEFAPGEVEVTDRALDVCIKGPGFLSVQDGDGPPCYTRDGRLTVNESDQLALAAGGRLVLDRSGRPVDVDRTKATTIGPDGTITQEGAVVGQLELTAFENPHVLRKVGENLYANPSGATGTPRRPDLIAGAIEKSTVDPVRELTGMIEAQRAYEANATLIRLQDRTLGQVINNLPRNL